MNLIAKLTILLGFWPMIWIRKHSSLSPSFAFVKFVTEEDQQIKHYFGQILQLHDETFEITFLRRVSPKSLTFSFLNISDVTAVAKNDVVQRVLPMKRTGQTARQNRCYTFQFVEFMNLY